MGLGENGVTPSRAVVTESWLTPANWSATRASTPLGGWYNFETMNAIETAQYQAETRKRNDPLPYTFGAKPSTCRTCGEPFWQWVRRHRQECADCAAARSAKAILSMQAKEGREYEDWLRSQYKRAVAEFKRLGISPEDG